MRITEVVVLYNPGNDLAQNIGTYIHHVDELVLWDNTPQGSREKLALSGVADSHKISYLGSGSNEGIGSALNAAISVASANGSTHLLTMDQDSSFSGDDFESYLKAILDFGADNEVIFSTNYFIKSQQSTLYPVEDSVDRVSSCMTSGSIYPLTVFEKLGRFREDLFVWGIDCEFSWRASRRGIPTVCFKNVLLQHDLGYQKKKHKLLGKEVFPNEYSPDRSYYNVRNGMVLHALYPENINIKAHLRYHFYKRIVFILLYENQKFAKWKALWDGYKDGLAGMLGKRR